MNNISNNVFSGIVRKITAILLPFAIRTAIIYYLGTDYLGLNSLFTSILSVLNLTESGFSSAIIFCMYKPLAENDTDTVCALLNFFRKIYLGIGVLILSIGFVITPLITHLIKGSWPADINIYVLFLIYLANTTISYFFFAYKSALLNAAQRIDVYNWIQTVVFLFQYIIQLIILIVFKNYYMYIIVTPCCTILCNVFTLIYSNKLFPQYQCRGKVEKNVKKVITEKVKGLMIYKLSEVSRNSFDSIVLSSFIGLTAVAIYNNYYYIFSAVYSILVAINQGIQAGVGNALVSKSRKDNYHNLRKLNFWIMWIVAWCTICMICLYQPFMELWVGKKMLLSNVDMVLFALYFYILNMCNARNLYYDGNGLWIEGKWTFILESLGNLFLNLILGKIWGITGVLIATIITIFIFSFIMRTDILFKSYYKKSAKQFLMDHLKWIITFCVALVLNCSICHCINTGIGIVDLIIKCMISVFVPNLIFLFVNIKNRFLAIGVKKIISKKYKL